MARESFSEKILIFVTNTIAPDQGLNTYVLNIIGTVNDVEIMAFLQKFLKRLSVSILLKTSHIIWVAIFRKTDNTVRPRIELGL